MSGSVSSHFYIAGLLKMRSNAKFVNTHGTRTNGGHVGLCSHLYHSCCPLEMYCLVIHEGGAVQ